MLPDALGPEAQQRMLAELQAVIAAAPLYVPTMPRTGQPMSVRMTNAGPLGWVTDRAGGYRYQPLHPKTGLPWPPIPASVLELWEAYAACPHPPEACLVNVYDGKARMGLHRDMDEEELAAPVVSISLGDTAVFRIGGPARGDASRSLKLASGAVVVLGGAARSCFHGVDRVIAGSSRQVPGGGRINVTLRRVTSPD